MNLIHILIDRTATGSDQWLLGGGSSTKASARVYDSYDKAVTMRGRLRSGRNAEIVTLPLTPPDKDDDLLAAETVLHSLGEPFWGLATAVASARLDLRKAAR